MSASPASGGTLQLTDAGTRHSGQNPQSEKANSQWDRACANLSCALEVHHLGGQDPSHGCSFLRATLTHGPSSRTGCRGSRRSLSAVMNCSLAATSFPKSRRPSVNKLTRCLKSADFYNGLP